MNAISKKQFKQLIKAFDFTNLFNLLGWNYITGQDMVKVGLETFTLQSVAEKRGFRILVCSPDSRGRVPDYSTRMKLDRAVSRLYYEHLIIFRDELNRTQLWQWVMREADKPPQLTETRWYKGQDPELLYQKASGLFFTLDEEENITIVDVTTRVRENFQQNREKVTKKFYEGFKKEHTAFLGFIKGIEDKTSQEWYTSLMLNRLMFCYFIQKKGFLDNNKNYLRDKLKACQQKKGKDKFYSFYRDFLLALFHKGLGSPERSPELIAEFGKIPYLNGGLFDVHQLEKDFPDIQIEDRAFERIFNFFDQYEWHLDTRPSASGREVNPDVIGYIFEKYINDRAQMGAYYTKEDITEYISKSCIIPYLFDETERHYKKAFDARGWLWTMLKNSGDAYIYPSVKYGIDPDDLWGDLPDDVKEGLDPDQPDLVEKRRCWNRPAPPEVALPTEIWREVIERRKRYQEAKDKIAAGKIKHINDFITYNLDIKQFALDCLENCPDPEFILHFYKSLAGDGKKRKPISILDPTCGSGAFLFAALNILEPLYEACLQRMKEFIDEAPKGKYKFFEEILVRVHAPQHPKQEYFIFKSIILNNLYGVDIMHEAVEIAKLRLFLKLVSTVEPDYQKPNLGLEPLPDVDFNIRAGNTLLGYTSEKEIEDALGGQLDFDNDLEKIKEKCDVVARTFARYKELQLEYGKDYMDFFQAKAELKQRLEELNDQLNLLLHKQTTDMNYDQWFATHQPFHWLAEFYEIVHERGGFDVIIGNPPYVVYTKKDRVSKRSVSDIYKLNNYKTLASNNLYAFVIERSIKICKERIGMIVPIAAISTDGMKELQYLCNTAELQWYSNYATRPGKLFSGVDMNLSIIMLGHSVLEGSWITNYYRWYDGINSNRSYLFESLRYCEIPTISTHANKFPKLGTNSELSILKKMHSYNKKIKNYYHIGGKAIFYHSGGRYWRKAIDRSLSSHYKRIEVSDDNYYAILAVLNSQLFYWYWISNSNCMDVVAREVAEFPLFDLTEIDGCEFRDVVEKLLQSYYNNSENRERQGEIITTTEVNFNVKYSKPIIDEIDTILGQYYGFTPEELDFIINYDIKYRMGKELGEEEDEP
jgi:type I restriction-modification system DNA methylase subunit